MITYLYAYGYRSWVWRWAYRDVLCYLACVEGVLWSLLIYWITNAT